MTGRSRVSLGPRSASKPHPSCLVFHSAHEALLHSTIHSYHAGPGPRGMDVRKEPRMILMLALLFLGPGRRTTATPKPQDVNCIVFDDDYMTCEWDSSQKPATSYSLYYRYRKDPMVECKHYLQSDGVNTGCRFNSSQINLFHAFYVYVNSSDSDSSFFNERPMSLQNRVKPNPPVNLTIKNLGNNQLLVSWGSTYKHAHCLEYMVEYKSDTDTEQKNSRTEEMKFILPSVDPEKRYTFYVKSKIASKCGDTELWSLPAGPVFLGPNTTTKGIVDDVKSLWFWTQNVLIPIGSFVLLLLLVFTLMRMERVWVVLMPRIPNPSKKFEELFTAHQGNFSEWAGVPKDAVESFKPSYRESICHVTELLPGGGYLPLGNDILGKAGEVPGVTVDPVPKIDVA
uniref:LOW QUALITY PROTEIN: cytokine receptor common subunit gamma n=1 Tax=Euleptes europaea TaxID=460621 RepID=UPI002540D7AA|nr:LOW QUALITY PROTEIN: cytokine receptor common subunit gamma [Euleptes europaea]